MTWPEHINSVICGDAIETMKGIPDGVIQCCVTSPPYWGLRDYGIDNQIGLESTPGEYVGKMVEVFREVRRILRDDGTLWLNIGDSYMTQPAGNLIPTGLNVRGKRAKSCINSPKKPTGSIKMKDLCMIPARVALALQADGWWLRSVIIWHKPSCMPESVTDRPTTSHEYVYLLAKSANYYYDAEAIKEPAIEGTDLGLLRGSCIGDDKVSWHATSIGKRQSEGIDSRIGNPSGKRNKRTVWTINPEPTPYAHFATFPQKLVEPPIMAGSKAGDIVIDIFSGSATVGVVAKRLQRNYILIDLNAEYNEKIAKPRLAQSEMKLR